MKDLSFTKIFGITALVILLIAGAISLDRIIESVDTDEVKILQDPIDGDLHYYISPGTKFQGFAKVTTYKKRGQIDFMPPEDSGIAIDSPQAIAYGYKLRFNDAASATLLGSISYELPLAEDKLKMIREMYPSQASLERDLIKQVMSKSVYMTGPTMSSKESYADKRQDLIEYIEDQAQNGTYKTTVEEVKVDDTISGGQKTIKIATIVEDTTAVNGRARSEQSPLSTFGIKVFNLNIKKVRYSDEVLVQIEQQRKITMQVQTAIAEAKGAEQEAIKAEQEGMAKAMTAKWKQEEINAQEIAEAEKVKAVAKLEAEAAAFTKRKDILLGEGQAEKKRLVMRADGALKQKLDALVQMNHDNATALAARAVPTNYFAAGGGGGTGAGGYDTEMVRQLKLMNLNTIKTLNLDMTMPKGATANVK